MSSLVIFIIVIVGALFSGALMAYPLYLLLSMFTQVPFSEATMYATQLCGLIFSLAYLKYTDGLTLASLGYAPASRQRPSMLAGGFFCGLGVVALLGMTLIITGVYGFHPGRDYSVLAIGLLLVGAVATGIGVSLFEETVFRGALLRGLTIKTNPTTAILVTSAAYACVHFIHYIEPVATLTFISGPREFIPAYSGILNFETGDALLSLFVLGVLLAMVRLKTDSLALCISLHAGLVAGIKLFRYLLEYRPGSDFDFLVSSHDHRLGLAALLWLGLATLVYYLFAFRNRAINDYK